MRLSLAALLVIAAAAPAASPTFSTVLPRGAQRGTEVELTFVGTRFEDANGVVAYTPGVTFGPVTAAKGGSFKCKATIAADCPLGEVALRVRTASGISDMRNFYVGALPCIDEKEPNTEFGAAQKIPLNVTVHGTIEAEDVDCFAVEAKKGQRITAEVEAMRLGGPGFFDPHLSILNSKRFELAACDDLPLLGQDAAVSIIAPEDGRYVIQLRDSAYGGAANHRYRLHVGTFPRPTSVVPAGGKPGDEIEVKFLGDVKGEQVRKVKLPANADGHKFGLYLEDEGGISPSPVPFRLSNLRNVVAAEPNDDAKTATPAGDAPVAVHGCIDKPGDVDYFKFRAKKGQVLDFTVFARKHGSRLDSVIGVAKLTGGPFASNDDAGSAADSYVRATMPDDGEYVLSVTDHLKKGGPNYTYRVEITEPENTVTLSLPQFVQTTQDRQAVPIPRGGRNCTLVTVSRAGVGGELTVGGDGLPAGVKVESFAADGGVGSVPVVFEAADSAPLAGGLVAFKATGSGQFVSRTALKSILVNQGNGGGFAVYNAPVVAVAVVDPVPFNVRIEAPKVPVLRNGSMNLKVVAERKGDFKGAITLMSVYNPPGLGSAAQVTIPEGQTDAAWPINANGGAAVRSWPLVVWAKADVNGAAYTCTPLTPVEVAPAFVSVTFDRAACEQGKAVTLVGKVRVERPFEGTAKVQLVGLPAKVTTPDATITKDSTEVQFPLTVDATAAAGRFKNILCGVTVTQAGEPMQATAGTMELRVDAPLATKKKS